MSDNTSNGATIGFPALLTTVFIVLKLTKVISWSWWWVLAPSWLPITVFTIGFIVFWILRDIRVSKLKR